MTASTLQLQHMPNNSDRVSEDFCRSERNICATPSCLLTEIFRQQNQLLDFDNSRNTVRLRTGEKSSMEETNRLTEIWKKNHTHYTSRYFLLPLLCPPKNKKYVSLLAVLTPETTKKAFIRLGFLLIVQLLEIAVSLWQLTVFLYNWLT